jgi:hypothetical protein
MSRFLRFPNTSVSRVGKGPALADGAAIEMHVTDPLDPKEPIPNKTGLQKVVERPDQRVIDSRAAKEKKQTTQPQIASRKRPSVHPSHRPHKRGHTSSIVVSEDDGSSDGDQTRSPSPINISHPEDENVEHTEDVEDVADAENAENMEVPAVETVVPENVDGNPEGDDLGLDMFATDPDEDLGGPNVSDLAHGGMSSDTVLIAAFHRGVTFCFPLFCRYPRIHFR